MRSRVEGDGRKAGLVDLAKRAGKERGKLGETTFFLKGSLVERYQTCGNAGCVCQRKRSARHGPYYQWTRKLRGKTESLWIPKELVRQVEEWMSAGEGVVEGVTKWEEISVEALKRLCREARRPTPPGHEPPLG